MSLYENAIFLIYKQILAGQLSYDQLTDLPENIESDLNTYLNCLSLKRCFYLSISKEHFIFADYFLGQVNNPVKIVNHGLAYAKNKNIVDYLKRKGATIFDYGLIEAIINDDLEMIDYFIELGAHNFNNALRQAVLEKNDYLIEYFIKLGADDFNAALASATESGDMKLINYFRAKGANNFNEALITAAWHGFDDLVELYLELGADDIITALGCSIDNGHYSDLLIPDVQAVQACKLGYSLLYFLRHTKFYSKSGVEINRLIPYILQEGYADQETIYLLLKLYLLNQHKHHDSYFMAFEKLPSVYKITVKKNRQQLVANIDGSSTFDNIKKYHPGFYPQFIDKLYFPNMIQLNTTLIANITPYAQEQIWTELVILKAVTEIYNL